MDLYYKGDYISNLAVGGEGGGGSEMTVGLDFGQIGYQESDVPQLWKDGLEYAKEIQENWNPEVTSMPSKFSTDKKLVYFPMVDTGKVTDMNGCFYNCTNLMSIPLLNTGKVTSLNRAFYNCSSLSSIPELNTENMTDMGNCFYGCKVLNSLPKLNTGKVTNMNSCFYNCSSLSSIPELNTENVTDMYNCFYGCFELTTIPELNTENVTNMNSCFYNCMKLSSIPELNTENVTNIASCFYGCSVLKRIPGLSFKSMGSITSYSGFFFGYSANTKIRYILIKDIGTKEACTTLDFTYARAWGVADTDNPDARQSLIDSLLTYSFDRASAGYSNCTIKLYSTVKALLTQEEIDAIQAKGYIIS